MDARQRLEDERQQTLRRLTALTHDFDEVVAASLDTNADDEHDPEGATIAFVRSQTAALVRQARARLSEIDAATVRLERGGYGTCEVCARTIAPERLEIRPEARTCVSCR